MSKFYDDLFKNRFFAFGSIFIAGAILIIVSWGSKGSNIIDTATTSDIIWSSLSFILISYFMGVIILVFVAMIKEAFNAYTSVIVIPIFIFLFYALFLNDYVSSEHRAANQYKKLIEKHKNSFNKETKSEVEYDIENIESERHSWRESDDRDDY